MSAVKSLQSQVGGDHYKKYAIQPLEFAEEVGLSPMVYSAFKYVCRHKDKGQGKQDLQKALHCIDIFLECGQSKPMSIHLFRLTEFLQQFEKYHATALFELLKLQCDKTEEQAQNCRVPIYYLIGDYLANVK